MSTPPAVAADLEIAQVLGLDRHHRLRRWSKRALWLALAVAAAGLAARVVLRRAQPVATTYQTQPVVQRDLTSTVVASGTLEPWNQVDVGPEISGRVRAVRADFNDRVTKGQVLVELDTDLLAAQVAQSESQVALAAAAVAQAEVTRDEARATLARARGLRAQGLAAAAELEAATAGAGRADSALVAAEAQLRAARSSLSIARTGLGKATIRSPIDGVVLSRTVDAGQTVVAALTTPVLFRLAEDLGRMRLVVDVDEADVGRVADGQAATFTVAAYPTRTFPARVTQVRNAAQARENVVTYQAVLEVDNREGLLRPGMTGTSQIVSATAKAALVVPDPALRYRPAGSASPPAGHAQLWLLDHGRPRAVDVEVGLGDGTDTVVHGAGLAAGAPVIVGDTGGVR